MSMPTYTLQCDRCDYSIGNMKTWGYFEYETDQRRLIANCTLAWCNSCEGFQPVECFDVSEYSEEWIWVDFNSFQQEVLPSLWQYLRSRLSGRYQQSLRYSETLRNRIDELMLAVRRKGDERCLSCGSHDHQPFDVTVNLSYNGVYMGCQKTDFIHPGCGGKILLKGTGMRFSMVFNTVKIYSATGLFLREERKVAK